MNEPKKVTVIGVASGKDMQEAWSNLLDAFSYACECKQDQEGLWPHWVSTRNGLGQIGSASQSTILTAIEEVVKGEASK